MSPVPSPDEQQAAASMKKPVAPTQRRRERGSVHTRAGTDTPKPLTRRRAETRQRLVDAAYEVFADVGIRDAPIELICERAGYTRGAFYSNFASKEEIFLAIYESQMAARAARLAEGAAAALDQVDAQRPDRLQAVVQFVASHFVAALDDDVRWYPVNAEYRAQALRHPELRESTAAAEERFLTAIATVLERVADALGVGYAVTARELSAIAMSLYESLLGQALLAGTAQAEGRDRMIRALATVIGGVVTPSTRSA